MPHSVLFKNLAFRCALSILVTVCCLASACIAAEKPERFPKPNPEQAFRELKIYNVQGSPLRQPIEDWSGARRRIRDDAAWRKWFEDRKAEVDEWIARRSDHADWVAGWWHDFVSPKDGSFLTWTPDEPGPETLSSPSDPKVALTPKLHAAWVFGFRTRHAEKLIETATLFRLTEEVRYAQWVAGQLDFYATNYARWPVPNPERKAHLMFQSLDEAVNLTKYANALRLLGDWPSPSQKQRWFDLLFKPEADLLSQSLQRIHNIACWQRAAEAQVAILFQDDALWRRAMDTRYGLRRQVAEGVTSDYFWFEQSMGYNSYVVSALLPLFRFASLSGRAAELQHEMAVVQNLMLAPISIRFPNGQVPNPADATGSLPHAPNLGLLANAYPVFPTTLGLSAANRQKNWATLVDPPGNSPSAQLPPVTSRNLESSRMAVLKQGPWQVFFHYGQCDASHAQSEALNFEAFFEETDITHDPGTVGYGSPLHRNYYTTGLSHNVPLVDGMGQERWNPGELIAFDAAGRVIARQPKYRSDAAAERELRIEGNKLLDTVHLRTLGAVPRRLGLAFHLQGRADLPPDFKPNPGFAERKPATFGYWKDAQTAQCQDPATFIARFGNRRLRATFEVPGPFTITHASVPDVPPRRREAFYLEVMGTNATFKTTLEPVSQ